MTLPPFPSISCPVLPVKILGFDLKPPVIPYGAGRYNRRGTGRSQRYLPITERS